MPHQLDCVRVPVQSLERVVPNSVTPAKQQALLLTINNAPAGVKIKIHVRP